MPTLDQNIKRLADRLPDLIKQMVQEVETIMAGILGTTMGNRELSDAYRSGASNNAFDSSTRRNTGDKLRIASGRLIQSFTRNKEGNENELVISANRVTLKVATSIPYAAIHEYGGTIKHPGGTAYFVRDGRAVFVSKAKDDGSYRKTKAHDIPMPARPYLNPAMKKLEMEFLPVLMDDVAKRMQLILGGAYDA